ncbi:MAG: ATP-dependent Clp protease proteolytic subunit, partial [Planctomycetes bacterium]|nr:ATP-dependent Clp protease proteolytic subunit [Planctomycetota bacterium]
MRLVHAIAAICLVTMFAAAPAAKTQAGEKKPVIAGIIFMEDTFFRLCNLGMKDAAVAAGCEYLEGNSNNRPEKEISLYINSPGGSVTA